MQMHKKNEDAMRTHRGAIEDLLNSLNADVMRTNAIYPTIFIVLFIPVYRIRWIQNSNKNVFALLKIDKENCILKKS